jgi:MinD-like ATPase involved in chromosome partitioning or flagellar assembly
MHDQADQLRKLVRDAVAVRGDLAPGAPIVAVTGGAPGVGATTLACGLARELARLGKHVVLVDANLTRPAVADAFNCKQPGTLADILAGKRCAVELLTPAAAGIHVVAGAAASAAQVDDQSLDRLLAEIAALSQQADVILIDAGAEMTPWTDRLWQAASQILLVTTPTDDALLAAYAAVKLSRHDLLDARLRLVVNRSASDAQAASAAARFGATCRRFLSLVSQRHAALPATSPQQLESPDGDDPFSRAIRLLAADIACDSRATAFRLPRWASALRRLVVPPTHADQPAPLQR